MPCACCLYPHAAEVPALPSKKRDRTAGEREQCLHCALPGQARDAATGLLPPPTGDFVIAAPIPVPAHALRTDYGSAALPEQFRSTPGEPMRLPKLPPTEFALNIHFLLAIGRFSEENRLP